MIHCLEQWGEWKGGAGNWVQVEGWGSTEDETDMNDKLGSSLRFALLLISRGYSVLSLLCMLIHIYSLSSACSSPVCLFLFLL